jgi:hypothetical protein
MRGELYAVMRQRGIVVERPIYDAAAQPVSEMVGYEAARSLFGRRAELRRRLAADEGAALAIHLLAGARSQDEVLARAAARQRKT